MTNNNAYLLLLTRLPFYSAWRGLHFTARLKSGALTPTKARWGGAGIGGLWVGQRASAEMGASLRTLVRLLAG